MWLAYFVLREISGIVSSMIGDLGFTKQLLIKIFPFAVIFACFSVIWIWIYPWLQDKRAEIKLQDLKRTRTKENL